jgi:hypothetical protein
MLDRDVRSHSRNVASIGGERDLRASTRDVAEEAERPVK